MAQTVLITLSGPVRGRRFTVSATDAAFTEVPSETGTLSLHDALPIGTRIVQVASNYTAGIGAIRIRNTRKNIIKACQVMDVIGEDWVRPLKPFTVEDGDIVECYVDTA